MRTILIFSLFIILSCNGNKGETNDFIGSYQWCDGKGNYSEWKFLEHYSIFLNTETEAIAIFQNRLDGKKLIYEGLNVSLPNTIDTLNIIEKFNDRIKIQSSFHNQFLELEFTENRVNQIDSLNLDNWKKETIIKFKKRADIRNCPDLRSENEKVIHDLGKIDPIEEEEIDIPKENLKDSFH